MNGGKMQDGSDGLVALWALTAIAVCLCLVLCMAEYQCATFSRMAFLLFPSSIGPKLTTPPPSARSLSLSHSCVDEIQCAYCEYVSEIHKRMQFHLDMR